MLILFGIFVTLLSVWWYRNDRKRYSEYPPGPFRLPILGNVIQIVAKSSYPATAFKKLADIYGDVMFLKMGVGEAVIFTSGDAIKDMLTHDKANNRTQFGFIRERHNDRNLGIIWGWGEPWKALRRFTFRNLRDFGFGKSAVMDVVVNEEIQKFTDDLKREVKDAPDNIIHVEDLFSLTVVNVLWRCMSGKSYEYNDPKMIRLLQLNRDFFRSSNMGFDPCDAFPILRDMFPNWSKKTVQRQTSQELFDYGKELLEEQRQQGTYKHDPESFIDVFTAKVEACKSDKDTAFTDEQCVMTMLDLLIAGSETSSNTLNFGVLYMLLFPEVQEKVQSEIDHAIPSGAELDSSMKSKLPYTCATVLELFRYSTIAPVPAAREATEDFYFRGYLIRKSTSLIFNVHAVHYDERVWGDPLNFRPERFLTEDGTQINQKIADQLQVFGAGKRYCLGQSLAEATIFLYFASMLRQFKFVKVPGTNPTVEPILGVTTSPHPFPVRIIDRSRLEKL